MTNYWWFGINNLAKKTALKSRPHVTYSQIAPVLAGHEEEFTWPYGGTLNSRKYYPEIQRGDKVLLWMGDGTYQKDWGIIGFARIERIQRYENAQLNQYILRMTYVPSVPIIPYPNRHPQETANTEFLHNIFGKEFRPLSKVFKQLGYTEKISVITLEKIREDQYKAVFNRAQFSPNVIVSEATEEEKTAYTLANTDEIEFFKDINTFLETPILDETVKKRLQFSRVGQERFRKALITYWKGRCAVTGFQDTRLLRASHIKPWRVCNNFERLDPFNGLLLTPNLDAVFDQGLVTFDEHGKIIIATSFQEKARVLGITDNMKFTVDERHQTYLAYHRELYRDKLASEKAC